MWRFAPPRRWATCMSAPTTTMRSRSCRRLPTLAMWCWCCPWAASTSWPSIWSARWRAPVRVAELLGAVEGVLSEEPLARHSQFGVGGPAQWYCEPRDADALAVLLRRAAESHVAVTMLGAGSNALILDAGIRGLVVRFRDRRLRVVDDETVELAAGCMLPRVARDCARRRLGGLEFGIGVPGTLGASVAGNAGAFGSDMAAVLRDCTVMAPDGSQRVLSNADLDFAYRSSRLKRDLRDHMVTAARLRVHRDDPEAVRRRTDAVQAQRK